MTFAKVVPALIFVASALAAQTRRTIPVRDFFRNPEKAAYMVSPNGRFISHTEPYRSRMNIFVQPVRGGKPLRVTGVLDRDIFNYGWKGEGYLYFFKDNGGDENFHLFVVDRGGWRTRELTPFPKARVDLVDELADSDTDLLVQSNHRDATIFDVYRINVVTGDTTLVAKNPGNITAWISDHAGRVRAASTTDGVNSTVLYRATERDTFTTLVRTTFKETFAPLMFSPDNTQLIVSSNIGRDKAALVQYDPRANREVSVLFEHAEVDVDGASYSQTRKVVTSADYTTWKPEHYFFDTTTARLFSALSARLPGMEIRIQSQSRDEKKMIVRTASDRTLGAYYLYDRTADRLTKIADRNPWLKPSEMAAMKPVEYKSRDSLTIHGYLTLPAGVEAKKLPVVVNPHGGPWARDIWGFNPEVQFLANQGYAVLQVNYRGSTGYGRSFWEASFKQWGKKMQDDVSDGVRWLIDQGIADPKRVAIYGGSYGGYATLAGLAFSPELYAAGVDYVGVSNLFTFMKTIPPYWKPYLEMLHEMVGDPAKDSVLLAEASPVFHVARIRAPLLVAQGEKDPRVNIAESNQIVEALRKRGIDVQYIVKPNEGHGFANEENRFALYEAMQGFLALHLKPARATP